LTIYVDPLRVYREDRACGMPTCHLATDGALDELHAFAASIGVPRMAFHARAKHPHYDLREPHRDEAVAAGAVEVSSKDLVRICFLRRT
jgi:hypothetical protein